MCLKLLLYINIIQILPCQNAQNYHNHIIYFPFDHNNTPHFTETQQASKY